MTHFDCVIDVAPGFNVTAKSGDIIAGNTDILFAYSELQHSTFRLSPRIFSGQQNLL